MPDYKIWGLTALVLSAALIGSVSAQTAGVAGEVLRQEKKSLTPKTTLDPKKNVTDIFSLDQKTEEEPDIYFDADELISKDQEKKVEAHGNVEVRRAGMTVWADKMVYDQFQDTIVATGHVKMQDSTGNIIYSDEIQISDQMSYAEMNKIKAIMRDGSQVWAEHFYKKENDNKVMRYAVYTPCDFCEDRENPLWRIRAQKVTHDAQNKDVNYNDAFLDFKGVPVLYTPFLSHPDPSVKRRSGFLMPSIGSSSYLGGTLYLRYFWDIDPTSDLLFTPILTTDKNVVWGGQYRKFFEKGYVEMNGTYLKDDNDDRRSDRGNLFAKGRYEINDQWVADADVEYASDSLYLKELDLDNRDEAWLTSMARLQRFDERDYASAEAYYYKLLSYDLRETNRLEYDRRRYNKPFIVPLLDYEILSDVSKIGSYWKNEFSTASVYHDNGSQSQRASMINSWILPWTSSFGERYRMVASVKSDAYYVDDYFNDERQETSGDVTRVFPQVGLEWRLPLVKATENTRQIVEPVVMAVVAPNGANKPEHIPNEDSQGVWLDDTNVLDLDRYAGYDRNDTGSRISYGLNWSSYGNIMGRTSAFIAQTYQFNKQSSFIEDIENDGHFSDYVGRVYAAPSEILDLNYRFRLDREDFKFRYNELGAKVGTDLLNLYVSYIYLQQNKNVSEVIGARQELYTSLNAALTRDWSISIYNRQDLTDSGGSLEHGGHLIYEDECFSFVTSVKRYDSNDPELDDGYEYTFTFYLKTLGGMGR